MAARSTSKTSSTKKSTTKAQPAVKKASARNSTGGRAVAKSSTSKTSKAAAQKPASSKTPTRTSTVKEPTSMSHTLELPAPRGTTKDGVTYTKDFTVKFLNQQKAALIAERDRLLGQAARLEDEAQSLIEDGEMGDVQFDDESGEGDTMVVEREHDLAMSAEARQTVLEIDAALERIAEGTYGYSVASGQPIPEARLEAIPWATVLVEEKVGGIGRR
jgi:RNA polymerase-binding transcription factor DksA